MFLSKVDCSDSFHPDDELKNLLTSRILRNRIKQLIMKLSSLKFLKFICCLDEQEKKIGSLESNKN